MGTRYVHYPDHTEVPFRIACFWYLNRSNLTRNWWLLPWPHQRHEFWGNPLNVEVRAHDQVCEQPSCDEHRPRPQGQDDQVTKYHSIISLISDSSIKKPKLYGSIRLLHQTICCRELQNRVHRYTHTQQLMVCFRELQNEIKGLRHRLDNKRVDTGPS